MSNSFWTDGHFRPLFLVDLQSKATGGTSKEAVGNHLQAGSSQPAKDGSDTPGMGALARSQRGTRSMPAWLRSGTRQRMKTVLCIRLGSDQGRSRCLVAFSKRSCSWEQDRETNVLIAAPGTRSHSAAVQMIESAAESEIGPISPCLREARRGGRAFGEVAHSFLHRTGNRACRTTQRPPAKRSPHGSAHRRHRPRARCGGGHAQPG